MKFFTFLAFFAAFAFAAIGDDCTSAACGDTEYCYESTMFDTTTKTCTGNLKIVV